MPLFVTSRDRKFLSKVNRELIDNIIETKIIYYQISEEDTATNIYGESSIKFFKNSYVLYCLVERNDQEYTMEDGKLDYNISSVFYFLRDYLVDRNIKIEIGNYLWFDNEYYEIDTIVENKYFGSKNPDTSIIGNEYGWNVSIKCNCHAIDRSIIQLEDLRFSGGNGPLMIPEDLENYSSGYDTNSLLSTLLPTFTLISNEVEPESSLAERIPENANYYVSDDYVYYFKNVWKRTHVSRF